MIKMRLDSASWIGGRMANRLWLLGGFKDLFLGFMKRGAAWNFSSLFTKLHASLGQGLAYVNLGRVGCESGSGRWGEMVRQKWTLHGTRDDIFIMGFFFSGQAS